MRSHWISRTCALLLTAGMTQTALARPTAVPAVVVGSYAPAEEAQIDLSPGVTFEISDLSAVAVAAHMPFLIAIRHAQLTPGKGLRISVSLDAKAAPGTRLSFQPSVSHGGTCRAGSLLPGILVPVFESTDGAVAGSCELLWTLDNLVRPRQAGSVPLTLHWKLESVVVNGSMARASGTSRDTAGTFSAGNHLPESPADGGPAADGSTHGAVDRPEHRRPPE